MPYNVEVLNKEGEFLDRFADFSNFEEVKVNKHVIYLSVKNYLSNQRQGTHKSKGRSEVSGSTIKSIRQKGSGGARRGSLRSPLLRGGGKVFGPNPNKYKNKMNKKEKSQAFSCAFKLKLIEGAVCVVDNLEIETPKTKNVKKMFDNLKTDKKKNLVITLNKNEKLYQGSRNLKNIQLKSAQNINTYDILNANKLFLEEDCVKFLCEKVNRI